MEDAFEAYIRDVRKKHPTAERMRYLDRAYAEECVNAIAILRAFLLNYHDPNPPSDPSEIVEATMDRMSDLWKAANS